MLGNLITYAEEGRFDVIVHGCNCFHTMGSGIAREIKARHPEAFAADVTLTEKGDKDRLGGYTWVKIEKPTCKFFIVNAYTQYHYGSPERRLVDYNAIRTVFRKINIDFWGLRIGYPRIGCGLAGGDWKTVEPIINEELSNCCHTLVVLK